MSSTNDITHGTLIERTRDAPRGRVVGIISGTPLVQVAWANGSQSQESTRSLRAITEAICGRCGGEGITTGCRHCANTGRVEVSA